MKSPKAVKGFVQIVHSILNAPPEVEKEYLAYIARNCQKRHGFPHMRGNPITQLEREKIQLYLLGNKKKRWIARNLHRDHSVVIREINRNKCTDGQYRAIKAHERSLKRIKSPQKRKLDTDEILQKYVINQLKEGWSPEQISGKLKNQPKPTLRDSSVCHETIYQWIYNGEGRFLGLYQYLACARKRRYVWHSRKSKKNKGIQFITPIKYRPKEIDKKKDVGHWESDSMIFSKQKTILSVQRERKTCLTKITLLPNKTAYQTEQALRSVIKELPRQVVQSITFDRGTEGAYHYKLRTDYNIDTYHADPYCSWQKGAVENTNMLIRRFLPLKTDLSKMKKEDIYEVQERLNNRPRKSLNYKTPNEAFTEELFKLSPKVVH
jgi:transposase, IS30 family